MVSDLILGVLQGFQGWFGVFKVFKLDSSVFEAFPGQYWWFSLSSGFQGPLTRAVTGVSGPLRGCKGLLGVPGLLGGVSGVLDGIAELFRGV